MVIAQVNLHGQVTLPAGLRKKLSLSNGAIVEITEKNDVIQIKKALAVEEKALMNLARLAKQKGITREEIVKACRQAGEKVYAEEYGD